MKIIMSNKIFLYYENEIEKNELRRILSEELTFVDPKTNLAFGKFSDIAKIVCYYHDSKEKFFEIPRGRFQLLDKLAMNSKIKINDYKDLRESGIEANIKCNFNFRDDIQKTAFESYINNPSKIGMINLACGLGKSFLAMKISEHINKQTMIIIDEIYLAQQWKEYYIDNTNVTEDEIFMLTGSTGLKEEKLKLSNLENIKIIITTKDTIVSREHILEKVNKTVGLIIADEAHVSSAKIFTNVIEKLNSEWTLGLTASPQRDDGMSFLVHNNVGPILYTANIYDSVKLGSSILPELKVFFLKKKKDYPVKKGEIYHKTTSRVFEDDNVMTFICNRINEHYKLNDSQLCITQKVEESKQLKIKLMNEYNIPDNEIAVILGETKTSERIELIEGIKNGTIKIVISSKIFDEYLCRIKIN